MVNPNIIISIGVYTKYTIKYVTRAKKKLTLFYLGRSKYFSFY